MSLVKSLIGRRQFLIAAGVTSTSALALKNFVGIVDPVLNTGIASAAEKYVAADKKGDGMSNRYSHLLSPLKIGNVVLKNRILHTRSVPHYLQGPETFPSEAVISHYGNVAKNGAAIVTVKGCKPMTERALPHMTKWDIEDPGVQNYYAQMADAIHFYDSRASVGLNALEPSGYSISDLTLPHPLIKRSYGLMPKGREIPADLLQKMIDDFARQAKLYQSLGYDMVNIYMSYRSSLLALSLSPALNKRTDKYGGSIENKARLALEVFQAIKKACGQDFLIEAQISGEEEAGGYTPEDMVEFTKLWEGAVDIIQLRAVDADIAHPVGFNSQKKYHVSLNYTQAIKAAGVKIITAASGGFQDLDLNEEYITTGKTDMIAMARTFICEPEYAKKAYEGKGEDVVPCIRCNKCHGESSSTGTYVSICSVNPKLGIAHKVDRMTDIPSKSKKVAVIGGGPAGMKAAIVSAERGHNVTIYEKNDFLGGQLRHADFASFQWPVRDFKDYLIRQVKKNGVEVLLNTKATPEMIKAKKYDAVVVATGAEPVIPDIPGANGSNVRAPIFVYGNEKALGKEVVVIGGDEFGVQTGMYLAENGHKVTLLASGRDLAPDATPIHYKDMFRQAWESLKNFSFITGVTATGLSEGKVTYIDAKGNENSIQTDSIVIYAGRKPRQDEALKFYGTADRFFIIGDCRAEGNIRKSMRTAFAAASMI
jgi:2,4-dienoyl-CoA reductase-like NADH-dependent reductase (Old Yellow Enzyme family)/thioredoxin reductase